jgi:Spy/CpxP family protein refolding chaperone
MERAAKTKTPEIFQKLAIEKTFSRRIPNYWNALKLTKRQKNAIYALQLEYFNEIAQLQARVERLEAERDARYREVLTQKQKETLDAKLAEVEKSRAAKAEAKEAAEEAEAEAAIE